NQAQTGLSEMALGLIEDDRVNSLGLHIEAFDSVAGFERLAALLHSHVDGDVRRLGDDGDPAATLGQPDAAMLVGP
ncbi:hypothetical protein EOA88_26945, partial [Mesorhizobium sp. M5C.F.Ca.IN.020.14.1.1]